MKINFNKRAFISLSIFTAFLVMLVTSVLMFTQQHDTSTALVHTFIGFVMLAVAFFHLKNNLTPLKQYFQLKTKAKESRFNIALIVATILGISSVTLGAMQYSPMLAFYNWGNSMRAVDEAKPENTLTYLNVDKRQEQNAGVDITIDLRKGPYFAWPQYAIWVESMDGEFIQPLYVTSALAKNNFVNQVTKVDKEVVFDDHVFFSGKFDLRNTFEGRENPETKDDRIRPESLPVFLHKLGKQNEKGQFILQGDDLLADAYTGATMEESFLLKSNLESQKVRQFRIKLELNHSFDFNEYYSSDRFPDDPVYSGNGYSAQPSVVYEAVVDLEQKQRFFPMQLIGRGHHSGRDGELYSDLENLTTALQLVDRVIVEVN